jgi:hypothetical protein
MAVYRDEVVRVSLAQIRAQYAPRDFNRMTSVPLDCGGVMSEVAIVVVPASSCRGGRRRWIRCPRCGRNTDVLGVVQGSGWSCARAHCGGWRSRKSSRVATDTQFN